MGTNLINNYISQTKTQPQAKVNVPKIAMRKTNIKAGDPKGHLLKSNLFDAPSILVKDIAYDAKSIKNGMQGTANDHQLGKINDLGMKVGGLALATYLFTKKATPLTKGMEFIGFASFFASMALWPKIAIEAPAKLIHGFNPHQKYEDSFGRKKPFFQDRQFLPWDLYSDKEIHKIGDRLGVPKEINNRREAIQDKMAKIATQSNTMWMLSAGFATPIMSALISNLAEKGLLNIQDKIKNNKLDNMIKNPEKAAKKYDFTKDNQTFENIFELNREKPLTKEIIDEVAKTLAPRMNNYYKSHLVSDLERIYLNDKSKILNAMDETFAETLLKKYKKALNEPFALCEQDLKIAQNVLPTKDEIIEEINKTAKQAESSSEPMDERKAGELLNKLFRKKIFEATQDYDARISISQIAIANLNGTIRNTNPNKFTLETKKEFETIAKTLQSFMKKSLVYDDFAVGKVAQAPETVLANQWNKIADSLMKTIGISNKEAESVRFDRVLVQELVKSKLESLVLDDEKYEQAIKEIATKIKEIDEKVNPEIIEKYKKGVDDLYNSTAQEIKKLGLTDMARKMAGIIDDSNDKDLIKRVFNIETDEITELHEALIKDLREAGSMKRMEKVFVNDRVSGVKNAFYRLLNTMDLYRRVAKGNLGSIPAGEYGHAIPQDVLDEMVDASKHFSLQGHMSDEATKYWFKRNPTVGKSSIEGASIEKVDIPQDAKFYINSMKLRYGNDMDSTTTKMLDETRILENFKEYRQQFFQKIGGSEYFTKTKHHILHGDTDKTMIAKRMVSFEEKFLLSGIAVDELFTNIIQKSFNTNKWLKIFGGLGLGVLGVTAGSQFFFGKTPKYKQTDKG